MKINNGDYVLLDNIGYSWERGAKQNSIGKIEYINGDTGVIGVHIINFIGSYNEFHWKTLWHYQKNKIIKILTKEEIMIELL